jgi:hypothetical protein
MLGSRLAWDTKLRRAAFREAVYAAGTVRSAGASSGRIRPSAGARACTRSGTAGSSCFLRWRLTMNRRLQTLGTGAIAVAALLIVSGCSSQELLAVAQGLADAGSGGGYSYQPDSITMASEANNEMFLNAMRDATPRRGYQSNSGSGGGNWTCTPPSGYPASWCTSNKAD